MEFRSIRLDRLTLAKYCALFDACFPGNDKFTSAYIEWLYVDNPDGKAIGYDAWEGDRLAAHYVCLPAHATVNGQTKRVMLSLNTATHPDFQGKGLFTKLAQLTYEAGANQGIAGAYGVANANSTPGFIRKLGFQLVRPLEARVGIGRLHSKARQDEVLSFTRNWTTESLAWRCANPHNAVQFRTIGSRWQFAAAALGGGKIPAYAELDLNLNGAAFDARPASTSILPLRLFIGLEPERSVQYWNYVSIPARLRPSPLNLIYLSLQPGTQLLDPAAVRFNFLDFDAY